MSNLRKKQSSKSAAQDKPCATAADSSFGFADNVALEQYHYQKLVQENLRIFVSAFIERDFRMKELLCS